ncbi:hypothetical protein BH20ACT17_BH20ACT17_06000 [soil metagenome]
MFARRILLLAGTLALACVPSTAVAQAPAPGERIAPGVSAAGVPVSGLTVEEAAQRLAATYGARLKKGVSVTVARRTTRLYAKQAKVKFDAVRSAKRALYAGRKLAVPAPGAAPAVVDVPLAISYSKSAVRRFARRADRRLSRAPRDAKVRITLRRVRVTHSRTGRGIDHSALAQQIMVAFGDPRLERVILPKLIVTKPRVNASQARRRARTVITIQQSTFTLRLFRNLKLRKRYRVAVGLPGYPTPRGRFSIVSKQVNPTWSVPNSPWAGELAGTSVGGGSASNPLKARWMGIVNGVGIHGTGESGSIGTRASHGCIRMHVGDVIDLFNRVPIGAPVLIG